MVLSYIINVSLQCRNEISDHSIHGNKTHAIQFLQLIKTHYGEASKEVWVDGVLVLLDTGGLWIK